MKIAIGQFTPPMAADLKVSCRIAGVSTESASPWVSWFVLAMLGALALVVAVPGIALWLPRAAGAMQPAAAGGVGILTPCGGASGFRPTTLGVEPL